MDQENCNLKLAKQKLHSRYIITILTGISVGLFSVKWSSVSGLPEMINMALALSSLILAGLAIVYSFHTSGSLNKSLYKIEDSSESIKKTSINLQESNESLRKKVEHIPTSISSLKESVDQSRETMRQIPYSIKKHASDDLSRQEKLPKEFTKAYLKTSAIGTLDGLMIFKTAYESKKTIDFIAIQMDLEDDFTKGMVIGAFDTLFAYNIAQISYQKAGSESRRYIEVKNFDQTALDSLDHAYKNTLNSMSKISNTNNLFGLPKTYTERKQHIETLVNKHSV